MVQEERLWDYANIQHRKLIQSGCKVKHCFSKKTKEKTDYSRTHWDVVRNGVKISLLINTWRKNTIDFHFSS